MVLATVTWDGGAGDFTWLSAANWSNDTVPTSADDAVIPDLVGTPTINIGTSTSVRSVASAEKISVTAGTWTVAQNSALNAGLDIAGSAVVRLSGTLNGAVDNGGTLDLFGNNVTIVGAMTGSGVITNTGVAVPATLTVDGTGSFGGIIQNGV